MILGLGHRARHGKDTFAISIPEKYKFQVYHFADALKAECAKLFGWTPENKNIAAAIGIGDINLKAIGIRANVRKEGIWCHTLCRMFHFDNYSLLQFWGGFRRALDKDHWVKCTIQQIAANGHMGANIVIPDMRHKNEAEWIKLFGGYTIRIKRIMPDGSQYIDPERDPNHLSECELDKYEFDYTINVKNDERGFLDAHKLEARSFTNMLVWRKPCISMYQ